MTSHQKLALASVVASMFGVTGCGAPAKQSDQKSEQAIVKCAGVNECAGQSQCAGALADGGMHDCAGKNSCKGEGWIEVPKAECTSKGGTVIQ